ncbi:acetyltransferase [Azospirillum picis]|uniref:Acetyltransferase n=1 Tax=Azospirillum picis TaxID=488438 RepID=A0ABU0MT02_9PROT|nr:acetyltransferase [Azospirillum picis]MBP2302874.1 putative acetyltransferase [Azospirillum picis]MDQ0536621.1 putative acetyltransferase [Azospirillum picis]
MVSIRPSRIEDKDALFVIWLSAVRATHDFLTESDIAFYAEQVRGSYLPQTEFLVAVDKADQPVGFMGMSETKIDALFVDPRRHGQGVGRALIDHARHRSPFLEVDVNEQNPQARAFYKRLGFRETGRSELDGSGRPFPLIHLVLAD